MTAVLILISLSIIAPLLAIHDPYEVNLMQVTLAPNGEYPMGTDYIGRCIFCRLLTGASRSILAALAVVAITFLVGTAVGCLCGYFGGAFDTVIMRFVDAVQAFPQLIFTIAVAAMLGKGIFNCIIAMSAIGWTNYARLARSQVQSLKERTYVSAAKISGMSHFEILFKTILPNSLTPLVVAASTHVGNAILGFSGLSFLGLGTAPPYPEWGNMLNDGRSTLQIAPWTVIFPGMAILIVVMIMGMFGDSLNEMLDPKKQIEKKIKRRRLDEKKEKKHGAFFKRNDWSKYLNRMRK